MDQDSAFMSSIMTYLFHIFDIKIKMVALYNHQSLQAKHGIISLSCVLTKHLTNLGQMWPKKNISLTKFAYNTFMLTVGFVYYLYMYYMSIVDTYMST